MTTNNQFDRWRKNKIEVFSCGCENHHGSDPVGGYLKICSKHWGEAGIINLEGPGAPEPDPSTVQKQGGRAPDGREDKMLTILVVTVALVAAMAGVEILMRVIEWIQKTF